jgi:CRP-like cAMP-binding protein
MGKVIVANPGFASGSPRKRPKSRKSRTVLRKTVAASFDPKGFLAKVGEGTAISKYQKDQIVFSQGEVAEAVFYIQKGKIKLTVVSERGKEAVVGILGPTHFFGEGCLNGHPLRVTTAAAIDECIITRITKAAMIATMHDEPKFSELFMAKAATAGCFFRCSFLFGPEAGASLIRTDVDRGSNPHSWCSA